MIRQDDADGSRFNRRTTIFRHGFNPPRTVVGRRRVTLQFVSITRMAVGILQNRLSVQRLRRWTIN
eukprot:4859202-Pleurochrysis_carterae.AAC.1